MSFHDSPDTGSRIEPLGERVPMFPLPNVFLFPGAVLPLHVFEPRYRLMVRHLLDRRGRLVMAAVHRDHHDDLAGDPPVFPLGGLGEIVRHREQSDGRFLIWVVGLGRARLHEVQGNHPYREAIAELMPSAAPSSQREETLRPLLIQAIRRSSQVSQELEDPKLPLGALVDLLLQCLRLPQEPMEALYAQLDVGLRGEEALALHARQTLPDELV